MASENKKNKMKNCYGNHGFDLKESTMKLKRLLYFNASTRRKNNNFEIDLIEDNKKLLVDCDNAINKLGQGF